MNDPVDPIERGQTSDLTRMIARGGAWAIGARAVRVLVTLIGLAILARLLTPGDFGVLALVTAATALAVVLEGLIDYPVLSRDDLTRNMLRSLIWLAILPLALVAVLLWAGAPAIERALAFPGLAIGLRAICPVLILQTFIVTGTSVLRRQHRFATAARISVLQPIAYYTVAIMLAQMGWGLRSALAGLVVANLAIAIVLIAEVRLPVLPPRRLDLHGIGGVGGVGAASRLLAWAATNADTLIIGIVLGPVSTGLYSRAYNISTQLKEPFAALDSIVRQAVVALKRREAGMAMQIDRTARLLGLGSGFIAAIAIVCRHEIVGLLLGRQFAAAAPVLAVLAAGLPARVIGVFRDGLSGAVGAMRGMLLRNLIICLVIVTGAALVAKHGVLAVAIIVVGAGYAALLVPTGEARATGLGSGRLFVLMLPGIALATILTLVGMLVFTLLPNYAAVRLASAAAYFGAVGIGLFLALPPHWLDGRSSAFRQRLLIRAGRGKPF
ncbi:oligosaccharide flippase family protein [Sphingomonas sp. 1P06PA]|uniref:oligosaccharide flippase family protein n=1 Tax=Sphingomonas sp. 1P06PA TaxID=554121 RepID=UPI0039A48E45